MAHHTQPTIGKLAKRSRSAARPPIHTLRHQHTHSHIPSPAPCICRLCIHGSRMGKRMSHSAARLCKEPAEQLTAWAAGSLVFGRATDSGLYVNPSCVHGSKTSCAVLHTLHTPESHVLGSRHAQLAVHALPTAHSACTRH